MIEKCIPVIIHIDDIEWMQEIGFVNVHLVVDIFEDKNYPRGNVVTDSPDNRMHPERASSQDRDFL